MRVSVCIATYRRTERLAWLLQDLRDQQLVPDEIVVVDNDSAGSARSVIEGAREQPYPCPIVYEIQPIRNISMTRNRTVHLAQGEWLAFIDDDERAPAAWLKLLLESAERYRADGVLAPVEPSIPEDAPSWIRRGRFYHWPRLPSGALVPSKQLRFGNVLLRAQPLQRVPGPFDESFALSTGEDSDMLMRFIDAGAKVVWNDEAIVIEPVESKRLSLRWLLQRALSGGQHFARQSLRGRYHSVNAVRRASMSLQWLAQLMIALVVAAIVWPAGRHVAAGWLMRASANLGKLTAVWGWRYGEYA